MPMDANEIITLIKAALPDATVEVRDLAGDGDHYAANVVSNPSVERAASSSIRWCIRR